MINNTSSITDKPITSIYENLLGVEDYGLTLSDFIIESATPLTLGMQGEWGTGKTSLMNIIREDLSKKNIATSWVNTWEYSLFTNTENITVSVLKALLENLIIHCKENNYWPDKKKWEETKAKLTKGFVALGKFTAKTIVSKTTGQDIDINFDNNNSILSAIAQLKNEIQEIINIIIESEQNPYKKIIFFIDDLDRIDPIIAVEILESLKNVFDIENCVFVLAIDYDVVVKGLSSKFGKKTEANEREFRSFFDKLIQVPFTMPVGTYKIENFLKEKLQSINLLKNDEQLENFTKISKLTVGYIPRSLKRYINTFSLLNKIKTKNDDDENIFEDFCLYALIGIQIAYPQIFRLLSINPFFHKWDQTLVHEFEVSSLITPEIKHEFLDEEWEIILWNYCQKNSYLKSRSFKVIEVLNIIRDVLGDKLEETLSLSMSFASITSVDDENSGKQFEKHQRIDFGDFDTYKKEVLNDIFPDESVNFLNECYMFLCSELTQIKPYLGKSGIVFQDDINYFKLKPQKKGVLVFYKSDKPLNEISKEKRKGIYQCKIDEINQLKEINIKT